MTSCIGTVRAVADEQLATLASVTSRWTCSTRSSTSSAETRASTAASSTGLRCEDTSPEDRKVIGELHPPHLMTAPRAWWSNSGRLMGALDHALVLCVDQVEDISDFEQRPQMEEARSAGPSPRWPPSRGQGACAVVVAALRLLGEDAAPAHALDGRPHRDRPGARDAERTVTADTARDIAARRLHSFLSSEAWFSLTPTDPTDPISQRGL